MFDALVESVLEDKRLARDEGVLLGERKGRDDGLREAARETARRMREDGFTPAQIQKYTGFPPEGCGAEPLLL
jgi:ABC-type amino acid transport substrate-binding protein